MRLIVLLDRHRSELCPSGGIEKTRHVECHRLRADIGAATEIRTGIAELPHRETSHLRG